MKTQCAPSNKELLNVEKAWQHLADSKNADILSLRQEIAHSWKRCLERKMCPINSKNKAIDERFDEYMDRYSILYKISDSHMHRLYEGLRGKGFIVILTTAEGVILRVLGDRKMYSRAESLALVPGGNCSENVLATTSPGICIEKKCRFRFSCMSTTVSCIMTGAVLQRRSSMMKTS